MEKEVRFRKVDLGFEDKKNLTKPKIRLNCPYRIQGLEEGRTYFYCTCGVSSKDVTLIYRLSNDQAFLRRFAQRNLVQTSTILS